MRRFLICCAATAMISVASPAVSSAQDTTAAIQKQLDAIALQRKSAEAAVASAKTAADVAAKKVNSAKAELTKNEVAAAAAAKLVVAKQAAVKASVKQQQALMAKLKASQTADRMVKSAAAALVRSGKAQAAFNLLQKRLQTHEQSAAASRNNMGQLKKAVSDQEAKLKLQQTQLATLKAAQDQADKTAAPSRKTIADAQAVITEKQLALKKANANLLAADNSLKATTKAAAALKSVVEVARQAAAAAKGTAAEKATADSVVAQIDAVKKVNEVSANLMKKVAGLQKIAKAVQEEVATANKTHQSAFAAAKPQLDAASKATAAFVSANTALEALKKSIAASNLKLAHERESHRMFQAQVVALQPSVEKAKLDFSMLSQQATEFKTKAEQHQLR